MKSTVNNIVKSYPITKNEYEKLEKEYGDLYLYASWKLIKNNQNNHANDPEDFAQELRIALLIAAAYYKRQTYIETSLTLCKTYAKENDDKSLIESLDNLWKNKTRHGANRQVFGKKQETLLEELVKRIIPKDMLPSKEAELNLDTRFNTYCKAIIWNKQKSLGKLITREKHIRANQVSLSEFDFLAKG